MRFCTMISWTQFCPPVDNILSPSAWTPSPSCFSEPDRQINYLAYIRLPCVMCSAACTFATLLSVTPVPISCSSPVKWPWLSGRDCRVANHKGLSLRTKASSSASPSSACLTLLFSHITKKMQEHRSKSFLNSIFPQCVDFPLQELNDPQLKV